MVKVVAVSLVFISIIFFLGTFYYLLAYTKNGIFPPKFIIRKRIRVLAGVGGIFLIITFMFFYFS